MHTVTTCKALFLCLSILMTATGALSQQAFPQKTLHIARAEAKISIDGKPDEPAWKAAETAGDFIQSFPYDTSLSLNRTEVKVCYDDEYLYVAAWMYDSLMNMPFVIQSLKRDWSYPISDAFVVSIDPFNDNTNGFSFGVNPAGAQREGLIANGGGFGVSTDWDNKWYSKVSTFEGGWTAEFAIPFKTLRFKGGEQTWHINFSRNNLKINENSCWNRVPRVFNISSLVFAGHLLWDQPLKKPGLNYSFIPYGIGSANVDYEAANKNWQFKGNAGFDAKLSVTPSLNLDLTVNPDFAQVEVDRQVINLTRFSIFFPEKRQFFIENSDLFANFGFRQIRPFFSRKIGLEPSALGNVNIPIIAGVRLSGKLNNDWRLGAMNVQTTNYRDLKLRATNYSVLSVQRQLFKASNLAAIFVNSEKLDSNDQLNFKDYNRVAGLEYNLQSADKKWTGKVFYMHSFSPLQQDDANAHASWLLFSNTNWMLEWNHEYVGRGFDARTGFVPRIEVLNQPYDSASKRYGFRVEKMSYWRLEPIMIYRYYPSFLGINNIAFGMYGNLYFDSSRQANDVLIEPSVDFNFQNSASVMFYYSSNYTKLYFPVDVSGSGLSPLPAGDYDYGLFHLSLESNKRKPLSATLGTAFGSFYNGSRFSVNASLSYRHQPWGVYSISFTREEFELQNRGKIHLLLVGPQAELSFSRNLFFSTFVQYNTQALNININTRLQWRFRPMSDLFIVYTDNYKTLYGQMTFAESLGYLKGRNSALVIKLVYWFNG